MRFFERATSPVDPAAAALLEAVPRHTYPMLAEVSAEHDIATPESFRQTVDALLEQTIEAQTNPAIPDRHDRVFDGLHSLFRIWHAVHNAGPAASEMAAMIESPDAVVAHFPERKISNLRSVLKKHVGHVFRPLGTLALWDREDADYAQRYGAYGLEGRWLLLQSEMDRGLTEATFVRSEVAQATASMERDWHERTADLFHATSSAALPGIAEHQALLCTAEIERRGMILRSGEVFDATPPDNHRLNFIFMDNLLDIDYTIDYSTIHWFNEFPVVFGYKARTVARYIDGGRSFKGIAANGHEISKELPISMARALYTPLRYVSDLQSWASSAGLDVPVYSVEAGKLLRQNLATGLVRYPSYLYRHSLPAARSARSLLRRPSVTLPPQ